MKICIQAGHEGRTTGGTGAPNEQTFTIDISNKVADELRARGFSVARVPADPTPEQIFGDWDLFLSIHYDADVYGTGGGFVDYPEPSTDGATLESQRIAYLLRQEYFGTTKIVNHPERVNANTRYYYMWKKMSAKTPCVIIECGVGMHTPDDHSVLHFNRPLVVEGIVKGICLAFNVPYSTPTPPTPTPEPVPTTPDTEPTPTPPPVDEALILAQAKLKKIHDIVWGKGWPWVKVNAIKVILPN